MFQARYEDAEGDSKQGRFGIIHPYQHKTLNCRVAVKLLKPEYIHNLAAREAFAKEAQTLAELHHTNVVQVFELVKDVLLEDGSLSDVMVMSWVEGPSLQDWLGKPDGGVSPEATIAIARGICEGLECIHQHGIIHGDLSPTNVALNMSAQSVFPVPIIIDFGLAWQQTAPRTEHLSGTLPYIAPEQIDPGFGEPGPASDIYALGALLFLLFSRSYYLDWAPNSPEQEVERAICQDAPYSLSECTSVGYPDQLGSLLERMLSKQPGDRPSIGEVVAQMTSIEQSLHRDDMAIGASVTACPSTRAVASKPAYSIIVAAIDGRHVRDMRLPLRPVAGKKATLESPDLVPTAFTGEADICIVKERRTEEELVDAWRVTITKAPFKVEYRTSRSVMHPLRVCNGSLQWEHPKSGDFTLNLDYLPPPPLQIAFLVDASLRQPLLFGSMAFVGAILDELCRLPCRDVEVACVLYGDFQTLRDGRTQHGVHAAYDRHDFCALTDFRSSVVPRLARPLVSVTDFGVCHALQLGLNQVAQLAWRQGTARRLVLIGNSPPHPTSGERENYQLLDWTADEFDPVLDWQRELERCKRLRIERLAFWVESAEMVVSVSDFAHHVWQSIGEGSSWQSLRVDSRGKVEQHALQEALSTVRRSLDSIPHLAITEARGKRFPLSADVDEYRRER